MLSLSHPALLGLGGAGDESGGELVKRVESKVLEVKEGLGRPCVFSAELRQDGAGPRKMLRQNGAGCRHRCR